MPIRRENNGVRNLYGSEKARLARGVAERLAQQFIEQQRQRDHHARDHWLIEGGHVE